MVVTLDLILRMMGLAGYHGIQTGVIFPFAAPIMSAIVIFSFGYFVTNKGQELGKKFYQCLSLVVALVWAADKWCHLP